MNTNDKITLRHKCSECDLKGRGFFCSFDDPPLKLFESLKVTRSYPKGSILFTQGQPLSGIYMLCQGSVKFSKYSGKGKAVIIGVAEPGDVIGLGASVSGLVHPATAEVIRTCQVNFIRRNDFVHFLSQYPEAALNAVSQLSRVYHAAQNQISMLALSSSVAERLAMLLVKWARPRINGDRSVRLNMPYKHEEIAEMIGASRETVTRLLKDFRARQLISVESSELHIHDLKRLEAMISD